jgi:hypothetical protein
MHHKRGKPKNKPKVAATIKSYTDSGVQHAGTRLVEWSDITEDTCDTIIEPVFTYETHAT